MKQTCYLEHSLYIPNGDYTILQHLDEKITWSMRKDGFDISDLPIAKIKIAILAYKSNCTRIVCIRIYVLMNILWSTFDNSSYTAHNIKRKQSWQTHNHDFCTHLHDLLWRVYNCQNILKGYHQYPKMAAPDTWQITSVIFLCYK